MDITSLISLVEQGTAAFSTGNIDHAQQCFLNAARDLLLHARSSTGERRRQHVSQATRLMRKARMLQCSTKDAGYAAQVVEKIDDTPFPITRSEGVSLSDVAGLEEVKRGFNAKFIYPLRNPDAAARYKQTGSGGVLLYGPPGTGKTFLVRALAGELGAPVFIVKPSEIMSKFVGETEQNMAALFEEASRHPVSLIFIDEIDALAPMRTGNGDNVMERLVPQLLAELDGFTQRKNKILFLGATNEPWALDPAMMRPGRFDELCYVGLPERAARHQILANQLTDVPLDQDIDLDQLAEMTDGCSGADLLGLTMKATQTAYIELIETGGERPVNLADFSRALAEMPRSVTPAMLTKFKSFRTGNS